MYVPQNMILLFNFCGVNFNKLVWLLHVGESGAEVVARLKRDLIPTLLSGVMYWPVCDFITFKFIPVHLQVSINCTAFGMMKLNVMVLR